MNYRSIAPLVVLATLAGACGGSADEAAAPDTTPRTEPTATPATTPTTTPATTPGASEPDAALDFESEPIQAGPLFGNASAQADAGVAERQVDPDDPEGTVDPSQLPSFAIAPADEPFCTLLADLEERPFPSDEDEALVVARAWFADLRDVAVADIVADLDTFIEVLDTAINSQGELGLDAVGEQVDDAADRIDDYVDEKCFGFSVDTTTTVEEDPPARQPETIAGVEIPVIELASEARSESTPYFGDSDTGSAGSQNPDADAFCRAVHVINNRPQPSDDLEEISVGQEYFDAIDALIPAELVTDFDAVKQWTTSVLEAGGLDNVNEPVAGDPVLVAVDSVVTYLDANCTPS